MNKVKELSLSNCLTECRLLLQEISEERRRWTLEMDFRLEQVKAREAELLQLMNEFGEVLTKTQARFRVEAELLNLIRPGQAGDDPWEKNKDWDSNQQSLLKKYAKKTH